MTVSSSPYPLKYVLDGINPALPLPFYFLKNEYLAVRKTSVDGTINTLVQGTDYNITGALDPNGGTLTLTSAGVAGDSVTILPNMDFLQEIDLKPNDQFDAETLERGFDKQTMTAQQLKALLDNCITMPDAEIADGSNVLPPVAARANTIFTFDTDGATATISFEQLTSRLSVITGNVPAPVLAEVGNWLKATAVGVFEWVTLGALAAKDTVTTADIDDNAVTLDKLSVQAANTILANATNAPAAPTALAVSANRFLAAGSDEQLEEKVISDTALGLLDDADADTMLDTLGAGTGTGGGRAVFKAPDAAAINAILGTGAGRLLGITRFTSNDTWTKATLNPSFVLIRVQGGGGAGGGNPANASAAGGGGGAGGYAEGLVAASSLSATETVTIGVGGTGSSGANGGNGGTSSFGSILSATGGTGGRVGVASSNMEGGRGGVGSGSAAQIAAHGGSGANGATATNGYPGAGGDSRFSAGGAGSINGSGAAAGLYGSGGGGRNGGTAGAGANGGAGYVEVWEFA